MTLLQTMIAFIVALGVLIVVHELGHYWVARLCGVKVLRFSVGMGKVIFSRKFGPNQTEWAISMLPLGGYVKMLDAREQDISHCSEAELKGEFTRQSAWKRIAIVAAGPTANLILAVAVFTGLYHYGVPEAVTKLRAVPQDTAAYNAGLRGGELITAVNGEPVFGWSDLRWKLTQLAIEKSPATLELRLSDSEDTTPKLLEVTLSLEQVSSDQLEGDFLSQLGLDVARPKPVLGKILPHGPAMEAGLREGDLILEVNGASINDGLAFVELVRRSPEKALEIVALRDRQEVRLTVIPEKHTKNNQSFGRIQAEVPLAPEMTIVSVPALPAFIRAVEKTWDSSILTLKMLLKMVVGEVSWKNITGPITIADYAGQTARIGMVSYLTFIAFISISLAVMNLLPIPVLDGGHLLYYSVEILTGRPVPEKVGEIAQRAGVGILITLMAIAIFNDVVRLLS